MVTVARYTSAENTSGGVAKIVVALATHANINIDTDNVSRVPRHH